MLHTLVLAALALQKPERFIPFQPYSRANVVVSGSVGGRTGTFLFDSGMGLSNLSPRFAKSIGCKPWGRFVGYTMTGVRLAGPHCDFINFTFDGGWFLAPETGTGDLSMFFPHDPPIDGGIGLDVFAGKTITIEPHRGIVVESAGSLAERIRHATPIRIRFHWEGASLSVETALQTPRGTAWLELDTGNTGPTMLIADHVAPLLGFPKDASKPLPFSLRLGTLAIDTSARSRDLDIDGNIGTAVLDRYNLTLDLKNARAWLQPL